jgi:hypothetical protein
MFPWLSFTSKSGAAANFSNRFAIFFLLYPAFGKPDIKTSNLVGWVSHTGLAAGAGTSGYETSLTEDRQ